MYKTLSLIVHLSLIINLYENNLSCIIKNNRYYENKIDV
jgi:hypothetical protein